MPIDPRRLLGLAFASADLLVELHGDHVRLALGAAQKVMGESEMSLMGRRWRDLFHADDQPLVDAMLACADDGVRRGPVVLRLARAEPVCGLQPLRWSRAILQPAGSTRRRHESGRDPRQFRAGSCAQ